MTRDIQSIRLELRDLEAETNTWKKRLVGEIRNAKTDTELQNAVRSYAETQQVIADSIALLDRAIIRVKEREIGTLNGK